MKKTKNLRKYLFKFSIIESENINTKFLNNLRSVLINHCNNSNVTMWYYDCSNINIVFELENTLTINKMEFLYGYCLGKNIILNSIVKID